MVASQGIKAGDITVKQWELMNQEFKNIEQKHADWFANGSIDILNQTADKFEHIAQWLELE